MVLFMSNVKLTAKKNIAEKKILFCYYCDELMTRSVSFNNMHVCKWWKKMFMRVKGR